MAGMYVRSLMRSTMYQKSSILLAGTCALYHVGSAVLKIDYSGYPKSFISRINKVYVLFNKISLKRYFIEKT